MKQSHYKTKERPQWTENQTEFTSEYRTKWDLPNHHNSSLSRPAVAGTENALVYSALSWERLHLTRSNKVSNLGQKAHLFDILMPWIFKWYFKNLILLNKHFVLLVLNSHLIFIASSAYVLSLCWLWCCLRSAFNSIHIAYSSVAWLMWFASESAVVIIIIRISQEGTVQSYLMNIYVYGFLVYLFLPWISIFICLFNSPGSSS